MIQSDLPSMRRRALLAVALASVFGCSDGSSTPNEPPPPFVSAGATAFGTSHIDVTWSANAIAPEGFSLYRSTSAGTDGSLIAKLGASTTTYRDSGLTANTPYFYTVAAAISGANPVKSAQVSASTVAEPAFPQDVTGFTVTRNGSVVTLSWDPYPGAVYFEIRRSGIQGLPLGSPGSFTNLYGSFRTSLVDTEIAGEGHYEYEVYVSNSGATQHATARASIDIPSGALPGVDKPILDIWSSSRDETTAHLFWWGSPGATAQHVYVGPTSTTITPLQTGNPANPLDGWPHDVPIQTISPMYYEMDVPLDILSTGGWCFAIEADDGTAFADSGSACITIYGPPAPAAVTGVHATVSNPTWVTITWDAVPDAYNYKVYRLSSPTESISGASYFSSGGTRYVDLEVAPGTTYYYRVTAQYYGGPDSAPSDYALARTLVADAPDLYPPLVLGAGQALLLWSGHNAGTTFKIYGGGANLPTAIDPNNLVVSTALDPTTGESPWQQHVSAPTDAYLAFLFSAGLAVVWGDYWIAEVYPDGTESTRAEFMEFVYL